jgi:hypothetical protein
VVASTLIAALATGIISYYGQVLTAQERAHVPQLLSLVFPFGTEGLLAVTSLALIEMSDRPWHTRLQIRALFFVGLGLSCVGNAWHIGEVNWAAAWACVPPCTYAAALHVLLLLYKPTKTRAGARTGAGAEKKRTRRRARRSEAGVLVELPDGRKVSPAHARRVRSGLRSEVAT